MRSQSAQEASFTSDRIPSFPAPASGRSFKTLLENSKFVEMVDPVGKVVEGEVIAVTSEHLYIDFGFKFHGVVNRPQHSQKEYKKGTKVAVLVKDLEVTEHFLGSSRHTSMLEADIELKE